MHASPVLTTSGTANIWSVVPAAFGGFQWSASVPGAGEHGHCADRDDAERKARAALERLKARRS
jgi:hypothetical protein